MQFLVFIIKFLELCIKSNKAFIINQLIINCNIQMLKPQNKKMSAQFIAHLKNTPEIPQKKKPKQQIDQARSKHQSRIVQGDFSRISCSYVLQNERLRKKSIIYNNKHKNRQIYEQDSQNHSPVAGQDIQLIKKVAKLEYLQKKGYLKPEEKEVLNKLRGKGKDMYEINNQRFNYQTPNNFNEDKQNQQHYRNVPIQMGQKHFNGQTPYQYYPRQRNQEYVRQGSFDPYQNNNPQKNDLPYYSYNNQHMNYNQSNMQINPNIPYESQRQSNNEFMGYKFN